MGLNLQSPSRAHCGQPWRRDAQRRHSLVIGLAEISRHRSCRGGQGPKGLQKCHPARAKTPLIMAMSTCTPQLDFQLGPGALRTGATYVELGITLRTGFQSLLASLPLSFTGSTGPSAEGGCALLNARSSTES